MMDRMRSLWFRMSSIGLLCCGGVRGESGKLSRKPAITVRGVRSSWEALATKSRRIILRW